MAPLRRILGGIRGVLKRNRIEQELDDELRAFLDTAIEHKVRSGMDRAEAMRAARLELGSEAAVKDAVRDTGWDGWIDDVWRDTTQAGRSFMRSPGLRWLRC